MKRKLLFALLCLCLSACGTTKWIYVDQKNASGPWDGTSKNPYATITSAVQTTKANKSNIIVVRDGVYKETFILKRGTYVKADDGNKNVVVDGGGAIDIISSRGGNRVEGLIFKNAATGIQFRLDQSYIADTLQARTWVSNCRFETSKGVEVSEFGPMSLTSGSKAKTAVWIFDNWFFETNYGIMVNFKSPQTGHLDLELLFANNFVRGKGVTGDGIYVDLTKNGSGSLKLIGWINNNLVFHASNGILLSADKGAEAAPEIYGNTLTDNTQNGVRIQATGGSSIKTAFVNNITVDNAMHGFVEASSNVSPTVISHNLFYDNGSGNYKPFGSGTVSVPAGPNNLDAPPRFKSGTFYWNGSLTSAGVKEGFFYLNQSPPISPAVNTGIGSPTAPKIVLFYDGTTSVSHTADQGQRDRGFHYRN